MRRSSFLAALLIGTALPAVALAQPAGSMNGVTNANLICDGVTDNASRLSSALTKAALSGNPAKTVYIAPADSACMFASNVSVPGGVTIWAEPGTVTLKAKTGNASNPLLLSVASVSNVLVYGVTLDGGGTAFASANNVNTVFTATNVIFDSVTIQNTNGIGLIFSTSIVGSGVRNSYFSNVGASGVKQGLAFSSGTAANNHDNFITGSFFNVTGLDAVSVTTQHNFLLANNRVLSAGAASYFVSTNDSALITGNKSTSASGNGFDVVSTKATITGNYSEFSGGSGFSVASLSEAVITGNVSMNNWQSGSSSSKAGLFLNGNGTALVDVTVTGNVFSDDQVSHTQQYGIQEFTGGTYTNVVLDRSNVMSGNVLSQFGQVATGYSNQSGITITNFTNSAASQSLPANISMVRIIAYGQGGCGGGGAAIAAGGSGSGGGGGGGAGVKDTGWFAASLLSGTYAVTIGTKCTQAAAGASGAVGANATFAMTGIDTLIAFGGGGGAVGANAANSGGGGGAGSFTVGNSVTGTAGGGAANFGGTAGGGGAGGSNNQNSPPSGSGGGGGTSAGVANQPGIQGSYGGGNGGASGGGCNAGTAAVGQAGFNPVTATSNAGGGATGASGSPGKDSAATTWGGGGGGGGGGNSGTSTVGGAGGAGGLGGGGGGGGGTACGNTTTGGAGGVGGAAQVIVMTQ